MNEEKEKILETISMLDYISGKLDGLSWWISKELAEAVTECAMVVAEEAGNLKELLK